MTAGEICISIVIAIFAVPAWQQVVVGVQFLRRSDEEMAREMKAHPMLRTANAARAIISVVFGATSVVGGILFLSFSIIHNELGIIVRLVNLNTPETREIVLPEVFGAWPGCVLIVAGMMLAISGYFILRRIERSFVSE